MGIMRFTNPSGYYQYQRNEDCRSCEESSREVQHSLSGLIYHGVGEEIISTYLWNNSGAQPSMFAITRFVIHGRLHPQLPVSARQRLPRCDSSDDPSRYPSWQVQTRQARSELNLKFSCDNILSPFVRCGELQRPVLVNLNLNVDAEHT